MFVSMITPGTLSDIPLDERLRRGASPRLATIDRVRAWMAAHASAEEARTIRAGTTDGNPFALAGTIPPGSSTRKREGDRRMNESNGHYMNTREAAAWLGLSPRTLDRYRVSGEGPAFHRFGSRVRYLPADLEEWASARRRVSTSDDGGAGRRRRAVGLIPI